MAQRPGKRAYLLITLFALLLVLFPFLFWYRTWFGRKLTDSQIDEYLADKSAPRHAQHALVQIGERITAHRSAARWYPAVVEQSQSSSLEIRQTAAWIMGQDKQYQPFHQALLKLIHDPEPMVRRNAALALSVFGDTSARPELVAMLRPTVIPSPVGGAVKYRLKLGEYVNPGTLIAHVGDAEVRAAVPGDVRALERQEGATVQPGDALVDLSADKNHVWEALRALYLVGNAEDVDAVERYLRPVEGWPETIPQQAALTRDAIQQRK